MIGQKKKNWNTAVVSIFFGNVFIVAAISVGVELTTPIVLAAYATGVIGCLFARDYFIREERK